MDPGEQTTGTRDEHYDLISVLYHALHGAETIEDYILDAEAADDERLTVFFREAQTMYRQLAEQAKMMLGILEVPPGPGVAPDLPPEGSISPGEVSEDIPPEAAGGGAPGGRAVLGTTAPGTEPLAGEEVAPRSIGAAGVPEVATGRIVPEDFDPTISALRGGVENLGIERALAEIDGWEQKLEGSGDPQLAPVAENLRQLRALLTADRMDRSTIGVLLNVLGEQVQGLASGGLGEGVAGKLQQLGGLLNTEGRAVSG